MRWWELSQTELLTFPHKPAPLAIFSSQQKAIASFPGFCLSHLSLSDSPSTLAYSASPTLPSLWFLGHTSPRSASGPLHLHFPLFRLEADVPLPFPHPFRCLLRCCSSQRPSLTSCIDGTLLSPSFSPLPCFIFFHSAYHTLIY